MTATEILAYNRESWLEVTDLSKAIARHNKLIQFTNDTPHLRVKRLSFARDCVLAFLSAPLPLHDPRYDLISCTTCGQRYQDIDFGCSAHVSFCDRPNRSN